MQVFQATIISAEILPENVCCFRICFVLIYWKAIEPLQMRRHLILLEIVWPQWKRSTLTFLCDRIVNIFIAIEITYCFLVPFSLPTHIHIHQSNTEYTQPNIISKWNNGQLFLSTQKIASKQNIYGQWKFIGFGRNYRYTYNCSVAHFFRCCALYSIDFRLSISTAWPQVIYVDK